MLAVLSLLPAIAAGWGLVRWLNPNRSWRPAYLRVALDASMGAVVGFGLSSCLSFLAIWGSLPGRFGVPALEMALAAAFWYLASRQVRGEASAEAIGSPPFRWVLRGACAACLLLLVLDTTNAIEINPYGEWDAFSIWNVRAKYLVGGDATWRNAVSDRIGGALAGAHHPGYPLLNSALLGQAWVLGGEPDPSAGAALALLFGLCVVGILAGGLAWLAGEGAGLLAALVLLGSTPFFLQTANQYADIPLAAYILGAVLMAAAASRRNWPAGLCVLSGLCAGFAAWTKNEGLPFVAFLALLFLALGRVPGFGWFLAGAAPALLTVLPFKLFLAPATEGLFPTSVPEILSKLAQPARWFQVIGSFAETLGGFGIPWFHPLLMLGVIAWAFYPYSKQGWRGYRMLWLPVIAMLGVDLAAFLTTRADLAWHLGTANERLVLQVWPAILLLCFLCLQPATAFAVPLEAPAAPEPQTDRGATRSRRRPRR